MDDRARFAACFPGYDERIEEFRRAEIPLLDKVDAPVYLDYGGYAPYTISQVEAQRRGLLDNLWANPHSMGSIGARTADRVGHVRARILRLLGVDEGSHAVVFVSGATAALKLVGEQFDWLPGSEFAYTQLNHNSVVGIRQQAMDGGAIVSCVNDRLEVINSFSGDQGDVGEKETAPSLFAMPAECNFSGIRPCLSAVTCVRQHGMGGDGRRWAVLLDASKFCATSKLDLNAVPADFVVLSFYKMFGLPTGLGALVIRRDAAGLLRHVKRYTGGGTLDSIISQEPFQRIKSHLESRLEDGTIAFTLIDTIPHGIDLLENRLGYDCIGAHCASLTAFTVGRMRAMLHGNGAPVFIIYAHDSESQGPTIAFSVLSPSGDMIGYSHVQRLATLCSLQIRAGCFCNAGACQRFLQLSPDDIRRHFQSGHVCGDSIDIVDGRPTGCLRISLGYATTFSDVAAWLRFANTYLVKETLSRIVPGMKPVPTLSSIMLYPIKSCAPVAVSEWTLRPSGGLQFDREWAVIDINCRVMSGTRWPPLATLIPSITINKDGTASHMIVKQSARPDLEPLLVPLEETRVDRDLLQINVCGRQRRARVVPNTGQWFTDALGTSCQLVHFVVDNDCGLAGFANDGDLLLISENSVDAVRAESDLEWTCTQFRPNLIIKGAPAFAEEGWREVRVLDQQLLVERPCMRCTVIGSEHFRDLSRIRQRPHFGVLLSSISAAISSPLLRVGCPVHISIADRHPRI